jgi:DnaK suppressor protein
MDQQTVERLRERLETERGEVRRQLDDLGARRDAEGIEDPELDEGFADAGQDVEQALERMEAGTYGRCERCGELIAEERLEALPAVRLCMTCKRQRGSR